MSTPAAPLPVGEPFSESLAEAVQSAAIAMRLFLAVADAIRRAAQKQREGKQAELGEDAAKLAGLGGGTTAPGPGRTCR
ncbi:hypothetical protein J7F03_40600 [Streptomyces sp. ISL-43]|uniref:hypothetical protein n=1 Tax=Streptomyces sp. ISL-43 TaxID=2819183 RepID=UPI001BE9F178|nr:hypothetical protein [Streptomyces sp. ISL-43]MBT2453205.1 hypothetical protein [Streptomyces sp. ISL-43]